MIPRLGDDLAKAEILIEANRQREKTLSQKMNEARELERIEKERAKRRQGTRTDIVEKLPPGEAGKTRDKVAAQIGMSGRTYDKAKKIYNAAAEGDEVAQEQIEKLDAGTTSISRALNKVQKKPDQKKYHDLQVDYVSKDLEKHQNRSLTFGGKTELDAMQRAYNQFVLPEGDLIALERLTLDGEKDAPIEEFLRLVGAPQPAGLEPDLPTPEEKNRPQASPAIIIDDPEAKRHTIGLWYQSSTMEKPEYTRYQGALTPDTSGMVYPGDPGAAVRALHWMDVTREEYSFSRIRFNKVDITLDDLKILALWGRIPEEEHHTITVHFMNGKLPAVTFFDGPPQAAAQKAQDWLAGYDGWLAGYDGRIRRIRYCDGAGGSMDISPEGLAHLARVDEPSKAREKNAKFAQKLLIKDFVAYLYHEGYSVTDGGRTFGEQDVLARIESYLEGDE